MDGPWRIGIMVDMVSKDRLEATRIVARYDEWTALWHGESLGADADEPLRAIVQSIHRANFMLWHEEDRARDTDSNDATIAAAKRNIDRINQERNDDIERCDALLLEELAADSLPNPAAELHSETPGLMLDRLSILSLKRYHTLEEIERAGAPDGHRERNRQRLATIEKQREDLAACLDRLWESVVRGERRFELYRQLKMYNDPNLNPVLYRQRRS